MPIRLLLCSTTLLIAGPALAAPSAFEHSVTQSVLSATVSHASVTMSNTHIMDNSNAIGQDAFKNATGVIAIVQNTGTNAVIQQGVTVQTGDIALAAH